MFIIVFFCLRIAIIFLFCFYQFVVVFKNSKLCMPEIKLNTPFDKFISPRRSTVVTGKLGSPSFNTHTQLDIVDIKKTQHKAYKKNLTILGLSVLTIVSLTLCAFNGRNKLGKLLQGKIDELEKIATNKRQIEKQITRIYQDLENIAKEALIDSEKMLLQAKIAQLQQNLQEYTEQETLLNEVVEIIRNLYNSLFKKNLKLTKDLETEQKAFRKLEEIKKRLEQELTEAKEELEFLNPNPS